MYIIPIFCPTDIGAAAARRRRRPGPRAPDPRRLRFPLLAEIEIPNAAAVAPHQIQISASFYADARTRVTASPSLANANKDFGSFHFYPTPGCDRTFRFSHGIFPDPGNVGQKHSTDHL